MNLSKELLDKAKNILKSKDFSNKIKNILIEDVKIEQNDFVLEIAENLNFDEIICKKFIDFCLEELKINEQANELIVVFSTDKSKFTTFAFYDMSRKIAAVYCENRHILDCFRSLAHELVHFKQDINGEITTDQVGDENDGVSIENEANSLAGVIMRKFGREHPKLY